jgi:hypothetical protein
VLQHFFVPQYRGQLVRKWLRLGLLVVGGEFSLERLQKGSRGAANETQQRKKKRQCVPELGWSGSGCEREGAWCQAAGWICSRRAFCSGASSVFKEEACGTAALQTDLQQACELPSPSCI